MTDRAAFVDGLEMLSGLYWQHPSLPVGGDAQEINLYRYGRMAIEPAEQIRLVVAVIGELDEPEISVHLNRGASTAWIHVRGNLAGLRVTVKLWADDVCERRPEERRKRDRWVLPPEIVAAVVARNNVVPPAQSELPLGGETR